MTTRVPTICLACNHLLRRGSSIMDPILRCKAFPDGIPPFFATGYADHSEPFEEDHGLRFEEREDLKGIVDDYYLWRNSIAARKWFGDNRAYWEPGGR